MLRDEHIRLGLRLGQLLLQLPQSGLQIFHLRLLVRDLLHEVFAQFAIALHAQQRGARQVVFFNILSGSSAFAIKALKISRAWCETAPSSAISNPFLLASSC